MGAVARRALHDGLNPASVALFAMGMYAVTCRLMYPDNSQVCVLFDVGGWFAWLSREQSLLFAGAEDAVLLRMLLVALVAADCC